MHSTWLLNAAAWTAVRPLESCVSMVSFFILSSRRSAQESLSLILWKNKRERERRESDVEVSRSKLTWHNAME